jgi:hypothetical protein
VKNPRFQSSPGTFDTRASIEKNHDDEVRGKHRVSHHAIFMKHMDASTHTSKNSMKKP